MLEKAKESHAGGNSRVSMQGIWCPPDYNQAMIYQRALNDGYPVPEDVIEAYHQYTTKNPDWLRKIGAQIIQPASGNASRAEYPGSSPALKARLCAFSTTEKDRRRQGSLLLLLRWDTQTITPARILTASKDF
jgi:hypothetical protein